MGNSNLGKARGAKRDEFYTRISDIENELRHYKEQFKGKTVFCNCDDPEESNFWKYFSLNFEHLGLKKLVSTHFKDNEPSYKLEITIDRNGDGKINGLDLVKTSLEQNGDFRSPESIDILKECDIVVTNPPFSLFREYISQLMEHNKKFLILGSSGAGTYKGIFERFQSGEMWHGSNGKFNADFVIPESYVETQNNVKSKEGKHYATVSVGWFTNMDHSKRHEDILLYRTYYGNEADYPKYDEKSGKGKDYNNYDAINVGKLKDIPMDYEGLMGVPCTLLSTHNPDQFEIVGTIVPPWINGKAIFRRLVVRNLKVIK